MNRRAPARRAAVLALLGAVLAACANGNTVVAPSTVAPSPLTASAAATAPPTSVPSPVPPFSPDAFRSLSADAVSIETAARLQSVLAGIAGDGGMTATVISTEGTWSGAVGTADGERPMQIESQFGIASVTKTIVAAQVMQLVEGGELDLDAPATDYLPAGISFDTNGATIRQLLSHRSGIPDWYSDAMEGVVATDRSRRWTTDEVLALVPAVRGSAGAAFEYGDTNYTVLGLVIEAIAQKPLVEVLRGGVLRVAGTERLVYQVDEAPTEPLAMPNGEPRTALDMGAGFLPSLSDASSAGPAGAIASDALSLARWWRAFCAGEVVSPASLREMSTFVGGSDGYGLGVFNVTDPWASGVGHAGSNFGYVSWAGCVQEPAVVIAVLANFAVDDIGGMAEPLVRAATGW